ncbi:unnamed protein product, partial [Prorocentrum cordatum]
STMAGLLAHAQPAMRPAGAGAPPFGIRPAAAVPSGQSPEQALAASAMQYLQQQPEQQPPQQPVQQQVQPQQLQQQVQQQEQQQQQQQQQT